MVNLTLADVDNFEVIVKYVEDNGKLKLQRSNQVWRLTITFSSEVGEAGWTKHAHTLTEVLEMAAETIRGYEPDTIENAVRLPAMHHRFQVTPPPLQPMPRTVPRNVTEHTEYIEDQLDL